MTLRQNTPQTRQKSYSFWQQLRPEFGPHSDRAAGGGAGEKAEDRSRPATPREVVELILQFAKDNPTWGYDRIADALANIGHDVSDQTVGNILKQHGIEPAPKRKRTTTWKTFLKAHWEQLAAIDFTTVEVWTLNGLVTHHLLFAMRLATREVRFLGCTTNPGEPWMVQMARNLTTLRRRVVGAFGEGNVVEQVILLYGQTLLKT